MIPTPASSFANFASLTKQYMVPSSAAMLNQSVG